MRGGSAPSGMLPLRWHAGYFRFGCVAAAGHEPTKPHLPRFTSPSDESNHDARSAVTRDDEPHARNAAAAGGCGWTRLRCSPTAPSPYHHADCRRRKPAPLSPGRRPAAEPRGTCTDSFSFGGIFARVCRRHWRIGQEPANAHGGRHVSHQIVRTASCRRGRLARPVSAPQPLAYGGSPLQDRAAAPARSGRSMAGRPLPKRWRGFLWLTCQESAVEPARRSVAGPAVAQACAGARLLRWCCAAPPLRWRRGGGALLPGYGHAIANRPLSCSRGAAVVR